MTNLAKLRAKKDVSQQRIANYLGISRQRYSNYELGYRNASYEMLLKLAEFFEVSVDDILRGDIDAKIKPPTSVDTSDIIATSSFSHIPIIGCVKAGFDGIAFEEHLGYIIESVSNPQDYFALKVFGDSMEPYISAGDIALIRHQHDVSNNELAVVILNGDCGMIKKVVKSSDTVFLQSFNAEYPPIIIHSDDSHDFHIAGKVVKTIKSW